MKMTDGAEQQDLSANAPYVIFGKRWCATPGVRAI
jgi:hypothetical protein